MGEKMRRFGRSLKETLKNMGSATGKILENLEKSDKAMNERMQKALGNASKY